MLSTKKLSKMKLQRTKQQPFYCQSISPVVMPNTAEGPSISNILTPQEAITAENPAPRETASPDEQAFRSYLHSKLPKLKAPAALRDRIRSMIENPPA